MEKNDILTLLTEEEGKVGPKGIREKGESYRKEVFCGVKSAGRQEVYEAARSGIKASVLFVVGRDDFAEASRKRDGRKIKPSKVEYDGEIFQIHKVYDLRNGDLELTCGELEEGQAMDTFYGEAEYGDA